jgi:hypothetical protein
MFKLIWLIRERTYWKKRAEGLEAKLDHERERNREHEDQILSRFVTLHGVVGVEARQPESQTNKVAPHQPPDMESAIKNLSPFHKAMLEMYEEEGAAHGIEMGRIHQDFYQEHILGNPRVEEVAQ